MAHNGGGHPNPLPTQRQGSSTVITARLLPRNANVFLPPLNNNSSLLLQPNSSLHRLRQPPTTTSPTSTSSTIGGDNRNVITLNQPRPGLARERNEYIETPLRTQQLPTATNTTTTTNNNNNNNNGHHKKGFSFVSKTDHLLLDDLNRTNSSPVAASSSVVVSGAPLLAEVHHHHHHRPTPLLPTQQQSPPLNHFLLQPGPVHQDGRPQTLLLQSPSTHRLSPHQNTQALLGGGAGVGGHPGKAIVSQPCSTLNKTTTTKSSSAVRRNEGESEDVTLSECVKVVNGGHGGGGGRDDESIICPECGRCRCGACRSSRPLPSTWICSDTYQCSAETTLDYCTCLCCVKAVFYHCCKDYDESDSREVSCADKPCSCSSHHRWMRWGCLCVLSAVLPCLLCYLPAKGCLRACQALHDRFTTNGCKCLPPSSSSSSSSTSSFYSSTTSQHPFVNETSSRFNRHDDNNATSRRKNSVLDTTTLPLKTPPQHQNKRLLDPTV